MNNKISKMTFTAIIAAIYFIFCFIEQSFASGSIQCRLSEALTILPLIFPEAIIGVTVGCLIFNVTQGIVFDVILGTLATFLSAVLTYFVGKYIKNTALKIIVGGLFPVIINALIIPVVLILGYDVSELYWLLALKVGIGQAIAVYGVGTFVYLGVDRFIQSKETSFFN